MFMVVADLALMFLLFVIWGTAAYRVGRLASVTKKGGLPSRARSLLVLLFAGFGLALAKVAAIVMLASPGWLFVRDTIILHLLLVIIPIESVLVFSIPRLRSIARSEVAHETQSSDAMDRGAVSEPALVLPIQAAGFGAAIDFVVTLFFPAKSMDWYFVIAVLAIFAVGIGAFRNRCIR